MMLKGNFSAEKGQEPDWKQYCDPFPSAGPARGSLCMLPNAGAAPALAGWCHRFQSTAWTWDAPICLHCHPQSLAKPVADAARSSPAFALAGSALTQSYVLIWLTSPCIFPKSHDPRADRSESPALQGHVCMVSGTQGQILQLWSFHNHQRWAGGTLAKRGNLQVTIW